MEDALARARAYVAAGANGIMIHSRRKTPDEIFEFCDKFRETDPDTTIVVVAVHESIAADSSEDQSTERTRATTGHTKKSQSAERKSHGVDR